MLADVSSERIDVAENSCENVSDTCPSSSDLQNHFALKTQNHPQNNLVDKETIDQNNTEFASHLVVSTMANRFEAILTIQPESFSQSIEITEDSFGVHYKNILINPNTNPRINDISTNINWEEVLLSGLQEPISNNQLIVSDRNYTPNNLSFISENNMINPSFNNSFIPLDYIDCFLNTNPRIKIISDYEYRSLANEYSMISYSNWERMELVKYFPVKENQSIKRLNDFSERKQELYYKKGIRNTQLNNDPGFCNEMVNREKQVIPQENENE